MGEKRRNYDDEFKRAAIRLVTANGHGVSETARNLGINANMLSRWKREDEAKQNTAFAGNGAFSRHAILPILRPLAATKVRTVIS